MKDGNLMKAWGSKAGFMVAACAAFAIISAIVSIGLAFASRSDPVYGYPREPVAFTKVLTIGLLFGAATGAVFASIVLWMGRHPAVRRPPPRDETEFQGPPPWP